MSDLSGGSVYDPSVWMSAEGGLWVNTDTGVVHDSIGGAPVEIEGTIRLDGVPPLQAAELEIPGSIGAETAGATVLRGEVEYDPATGLFTAGRDDLVVGWVGDLDDDVGYVEGVGFYRADTGTWFDQTGEPLAIEGQFVSLEELSPEAQAGLLRDVADHETGQLPDGTDAQELYLDPLTGELHSYDPSVWVETDAGWVDLDDGSIREHPTSDDTIGRVDRDELDTLRDQAATGGEAGGGSVYDPSVWMSAEGGLWVNTDTGVVHDSIGGAPVEIEGTIRLDGVPPLQAAELEIPGSIGAETAGATVLRGEVEYDPATGLFTAGRDDLVVGWVGDLDDDVGYVEGVGFYRADTGTWFDQAGEPLAIEGQFVSLEELSPEAQAGLLRDVADHETGQLPDGADAQELYLDPLTGELHSYDPSVWVETDAGWVDLDDGSVREHPTSDDTIGRVDRDELDTLRDQAATGGEAGGGSVYDPSVWMSAEGGLWVNTDTGVVHDSIGGAPVEIEGTIRLDGVPPLQAAELEIPGSIGAETAGATVLRGEVEYDPATGLFTAGRDDLVVGWVGDLDDDVGYVEGVGFYRADTGTWFDQAGEPLAIEGQFVSLEELSPEAQAGLLRDVADHETGQLPDGADAQELYLDPLTGELHSYDPSVWVETDAGWVDLDDGSVREHPTSDDTIGRVDRDELDTLRHQAATGGEADLATEPEPTEETTPTEEATPATEPEPTEETTPATEPEPTEETTPATEPEPTADLHEPQPTAEQAPEPTADLHEPQPTAEQAPEPTADLHEPQPTAEQAPEPTADLHEPQPTAEQAPEPTADLHEPQPTAEQAPEPTADLHEPQPTAEQAPEPTADLHEPQPTAEQAPEPTADLHEPQPTAEQAPEPTADLHEPQPTAEQAPEPTADLHEPQPTAEQAPEPTADLHEPQPTAEQAPEPTADLHEPQPTAEQAPEPTADLHEPQPTAEQAPEPTADLHEPQPTAEQAPEPTADLHDPTADVDVAEPSKGAWTGRSFRPDPGDEEGTFGGWKAPSRPGFRRKQEDEERIETPAPEPAIPVDEAIRVAEQVPQPTVDVPEPEPVAEAAPEPTGGVWTGTGPRLTGDAEPTFGDWKTPSRPTLRPKPDGEEAEPAEPIEPVFEPVAGERYVAEPFVESPPEPDEPFKDPQIAEPIAEPVIEPPPEPHEPFRDPQIAEPIADPVIEPPPVRPLFGDQTEPVFKPVAEPVVESVAEPVVEPPPVRPLFGDQTEPVFKPMAEPVVESVAEPVVEPPPEPVFKPVAEPVVESVAEPVVEPVAEPDVEPAALRPLFDNQTEPVVEPVAEPVVEPPPEPDGPFRDPQIIEPVIIEPVIIEPVIIEPVIIEPVVEPVVIEPVAEIEQIEPLSPELDQPTFQVMDPVADLGKPDASDDPDDLGVLDG